MADMLNTRPLDHSVTEIDYKPISGWAIAALSIASVYVLVVGTIAVTAFYNRQPTLPTAWLILAVVGWVLAIVARVHIKRSEGTRTGLRQATVAWWMCVLGGAGFFAYILASKLALEQQALKAANDWFDLLKQSKNDSAKLNEAFLLTIEPTKRQDVDPSNLNELDARFGAGPLPGFRNSDLVRLFERNGNDVEAIPLGVSSWQQIDTGYQIDYSFQLRSPEGMASLTLVLFGSEGKNFDGRQWHFVMPQGGMTIQSRTTYGRLLAHLQDEAREFAMVWIQSYAGRQSADYYFMTLPIAQRLLFAVALDATRIVFQKVMAVTFGTNEPFPSPPLALTAIPGVALSVNEAKSGSLVFNGLQANGFFGIGTVTEEKKEQLRQAFATGLILKAGDSRMINLETAPQIVVTSEEIRYTFPIEMGLPGKPQGFCGGRLVLVSQNPQIIAELNEQQAKMKQLLNDPAKPELPKDESSFNLLGNRPSRDWRVLRLETNLSPLSAPKQPGGPGGPGGPPGGAMGPPIGGK